ncbi:MAG: amidohydrolase [Frankiales bacterium]|nr:amidohydrolase [Frankiales bacterium]
MTPRVVDTHTHYVPPSYRRALLEAGERSASFAVENRLRLLSASQPDLSANRADRRLDDMAEAGVDHSLVSLPPPAATFGGADVARAANDELLEAADGSDGRLSVLLSLPLPDRDLALAELDRCGGSSLVSGVQVLTTGRTRDVAPDAAEEVLAAVAARGLPVVLHPAVEPLPPVYDEWMLEASLAPVMSSTVALARLALSGVLDRVPDLVLVVPHLGGFLPYVLQRVEDFGRGEAEHDLGHYLRTRVHLDTCSYHPPALRCAAETVGVERLVLGTDYPFRGALFRGVDDVRAAFSPTDAAAVLGGTASGLFPALRV